MIAHRIEEDLSQAQLAARLGTSVSAVSRLESGQHRPNVETLERLGRAFGKRLIIGFESQSGERELVSIGDYAAESQLPDVDRSEIRRAIRMTDMEREAYFLASNRNMLRLFADGRIRG